MIWAAHCTLSCIVLWYILVDIYRPMHCVWYGGRHVSTHVVPQLEGVYFLEIYCLSCLIYFCLILSADERQKGQWFDSLQGSSAGSEVLLRIHLTLFLTWLNNTLCFAPAWPFFFGYFPQFLYSYFISLSQV